MKTRVFSLHDIGENMNKHSLAMIIRYISVAPVIAFFLLTLLFAVKPTIIGGWTVYIVNVIFLTVLPLSAYPLQPLFPHFRHKGREGQRDLAMLMAVIGYVGAAIASIAAKAPFTALAVSLTYLISGLLITIFNKLFKIRASGHACGVSGPIATAALFLGPWYLLGFFLLPAVYWASLYIKRHDWPQLLWGTVIPWIALAISYFLAELICC